MRQMILVLQCENVATIVLCSKLNWRETYKVVLFHRHTTSIASLRPSICIMSKLLRHACAQWIAN